MNVLKTMFAFIVIFLLCFIFGSFAVYIYRDFPLLVWAWSSFCGLYYLSALLSPVMLLSRESDGVSGGLILISSSAVMYLFNGTMLHIAKAWEISIDPYSLWMLNVPVMIFDAVSRFFIALWAALTGTKVIFDRPEQIASPPLARRLVVGEVNIGPFVSWLVEFFWEIVVGVIGGICTAIILRGRGRS